MYVCECQWGEGDGLFGGERVCEILRHQNLYVESTGLNRQNSVCCMPYIDYDMTSTTTARLGMKTARRLNTIRTIGTSASVARSRDVMAKYRRPLPLPTFETASTVPAAASFQDVPAPNTTAGHVRKAVPIPAMIPTPPTEPHRPTTETDKEMIVQGVVIPAKPTPPKDDGTFPVHQQ